MAATEAAELSALSAFERELLLAERQRMTVLLRIFAIGMVVAFVVVTLLPEITPAVVRGKPIRFAVPCTMLFGLVFEGLTRRHLDRCLATGQPFRASLRYLLCTVELLIPGMVTLLMTNSMPLFVALNSTAPQIWFLFIVLSTLRMDFKLSLFTGAVAGAQQLALTWLLMNAPDPNVPLKLVVPQFQYGKAMILLVCGLLAGLIGRELARRFRNASHAVAERAHVLEVFGQHVSPAVVERLMEQAGEISSEVKHVCVMFLDIRGFTAFSESRRPEEVVDYLNALFAFMIDAVNRNGGIVNKFLGDGFMAIFGAPIADGSASAHAIAAGREIIAEVDRLSASGQIPPTRIGIGLHAGEVVTGQVGSRARKEYTIIGDVVNLASRIEAMNKDLDSRGLASGTVVEGLQGQFDLQDRGDHAIRGRKEPVKLWQFG